MIGLTRTNGEHCALDPDLVQRVECHSDTIVHLTDGAKYAVVDSMDDVVQKMRDHRAAALGALYRLVDLPPTDRRERGGYAAVGEGSVLPFPGRPEA